MSAKEYSLRIELLLRKINSNYCEKSDEILLNPYNEIVSALQYYVSQEKLDKFKLSSIGLCLLMIAPLKYSNIS